MGNSRLWNEMQKKRFRAYQVFIVISLIITFLSVFTSDFGPSGFYTPDGWAQMSISVGASILTLVAIIAAIVLSNENNKRIEMTDNLAAMLNKMEEKERTNPDRSLSEIYAQSKTKVAEIIDTF